MKASSDVLFIYCICGFFHLLFYCRVHRTDWIHKNSPHQLIYIHLDSRLEERKLPLNFYCIGFTFYISILSIKSIYIFENSHHCHRTAIYNQHKIFFPGHCFHPKVQLVGEKMKNSAFYFVHTAKVFVMRKLGFLAGITWLNKHKDGCLPSSDT